ncbi:MAG: Hydrolase, alpha/beta fold family, partial [uncultured Thermomicrobiales bacterium]
ERDRNRLPRRRQGSLRRGQRPPDVLRGPRHRSPAGVAARRLHDDRGDGAAARALGRDPPGHRGRTPGARAHRRRRPPSDLRGDGRRHGRAAAPPGDRAGRRGRLQHGRRGRDPARDPAPGPGRQAGPDLGQRSRRRHAPRAAGDDRVDHAGDVRRVAVRGRLPEGRAGPGGLPDPGREAEGARRDALCLAGRRDPRDRGANPDRDRRRRRDPARARGRDAPAPRRRRDGRPGRAAGVPTRRAARHPPPRNPGARRVAGADDRGVPRRAIGDRM